MGEYDLSGLSSRSFEQLIQALAVKVLGAGTVVFGDGPDGGREATFEGRMDYPSERDPWEGYCVIQAKFRQRPEGTRKDGEWALEQLTKELEDYADRKKRRRVPKYYILATNVVLSPAQNKGAKDKLAVLFRRYAKKVPIEDWRVWDNDQIATFLDDAADIRRAYAAWVTPGDVLAAVLDGLEPTRPDFLEVMSSFLARDLLRDQYANLEQAGHAAEDKIPLARVFVDLPTTTQPTAEPPEKDRHRKSRVAELTATLVESARDPLGPVATMDGDLRTGEVPGPSEAKPQPGRYVLVGGPGQGKTTLGQFVCQLFRASLLLDRPPTQLPPEVHNALQEVHAHCKAAGLVLPQARRFPVRIVLNELATALSNDSEISMLDYLANLVRKRTSREVSTDDLRTWLSAYPWLIVLDGLDEVPASTNRDEVLRKVEELWIDAAQCEADLLVLATTRPQGYNEDFSPIRYRHLWLAPLSVERAMVYARRLAEVRYAGDEERQRKILRRLEQSSRSDATARLMRTPLQVTILATLVDHIGPPPQDRWQLFAEYYDVIYRRERERDIPAAAILRDHRPNIDTIHYHVGLLLQLEAERVGGTEARLSAQRFEEIVTARLEEEGYEGPALDHLRRGIIEAAAHRLVFLVGLEADKVGFEIRSLQEFMAAEALMSGTDEDIQGRLRRIAPISSWRNVFLFAAGRCFSQPDKEHFRETIFTLCSTLNDEETGEVPQVLLAGSHLALELLEDGIARQQPKYARLLADCTCHLLQLPSTGIHRRLAVLGTRPTDKLFFEEVSEWLDRGIPESLGAWASLCPLVDQGLPLAIQLVEQYWPSEPKKQLALLKIPGAAEIAYQWPGLVEQAIRANPPQQGYEISFNLPISLLEGREWTGKKYEFTRMSQYKRHRPMKPNFDLLNIQFSFSSLLEADKFFSGWMPDAMNVHPGWLPTLEARRFSLNPSRKSLWKALTCAAKFADPSSVFRAGEIPWVLGACLTAARAESDLANLADRASDGQLGDIGIWRAAERRWEEQGVQLDDLLYMTDDRWPFDHTIAKRGLVILTLGYTAGTDCLRDYMKLVEPLANADQLKRTLGWAALRSLTVYRSDPPPGWLDPDKVNRLFMLDIPADLSELTVLAHWAKYDAAWLSVLDSVGRTKPLTTRFTHDVNEATLFSNLFQEHPDKPGLLPLLAIALIRDPDSEAIPRTPLQFEDFADPPVRGAAILIELARGDSTAARAKELAAETARMGESQRDLWWLSLRLFEGLERLDSSSVRYLMELKSLAGTENWERRGAILATLENSFQRRNSGLGDQSVWRSLGLPEVLPGMST